MSQQFVYAVSVAITALIQGGGFLVAYALQTETFYDILGGVNFLALVCFERHFGFAQDLHYSLVRVLQGLAAGLPGLACA